MKILKHLLSLLFLFAFAFVVSCKEEYPERTRHEWKVYRYEVSDESPGEIFIDRIYLDEFSHAGNWLYFDKKDPADYCRGGGFDYDIRGNRLLLYRVEDFDRATETFTNEPFQELTIVERSEGSLVVRLYFRHQEDGDFMITRVDEAENSLDENTYNITYYMEIYYGGPD